MNTTSGQPVTVRDVLLEDTGMASALQASRAADLVSGRLVDFTQATREQAVREVGRISADLLDLNFADLIIGALASYASLQEAARRTAAAPGTEELVELISHQVALDNQPSIELLVDGAHVATVHLLLLLVIDIQALTATVRQGRLVTVQLGRCDIDAALCIERVPVASKKATLQLPVFLPVGSRIPLAKPERHQAPSS